MFNETATYVEDPESTYLLQKEAPLDSTVIEHSQNLTPLKGENTPAKPDSAITTISPLVSLTARYNLRHDIPMEDLAVSDAETQLVSLRDVLLPAKFYAYYAREEKLRSISEFHEKDALHFIYKSSSGDYYDLVIVPHNSASEPASGKPISPHQTTYSFAAYVLQAPTDANNIPHAVKLWEKEVPARLSKSADIPVNKRLTGPDILDIMQILKDDEIATTAYVHDKKELFNETTHPIGLTNEEFKEAFPGLTGMTITS